MPSRIPTMRPSQGHRSRTLDLVQTGGLSRSAAASLGQGGTPSGNNLWVATTAQSVGAPHSSDLRGQVVHLPTLEQPR